VSTGVLLPLLVFAALGLPIFALLWRVFVVGGELRRDAQHGRAAKDLAHRADWSLAELSEIVDDIRRHKTGPEAGAASLAASEEALRRYAVEAEAIDKRATHAEGGGLLPEIERAQRAVELIEYGRGLMLDPHADASEGETSVKRGYLNLLHAREAIRARGAEIEAGVLPPSARPNTDPLGPSRKR
jgi:hypothetical protein